MTELPMHMNVVAPRAPGGPEMFETIRRPIPVPARGEVLVKVRSAGVNRADCLQRQGQYPVPAGATDIIGLECSGEVVALGEEVSRWKPGDAVCALLVGGGYAEYVAVPEAQCLPCPAGMGWDDAASLMEAMCTVWSNVRLRGGLGEGQTLLVHGGSSGIGVTALQIFAAFGHRIWTTAGSDEKCAACLEIGATRAINYRREVFENVVLAETGGRGVDVVLDMVGGDYLGRNLKALADDGRLVGIAASGGRVASVDLLELYRRRQTLTGSGLRRQPLAEKARIVASVEENLWPLLASGRIKPLVYRSFPWVEAGAAHALMESSAHIGKIVLRVA